MAESKIDKTITKVIEYIDWYKAYDEANDDGKKALVLKYPNEISSLLVDIRTKVETYFKEVVDQPVYKTNDYLRLRKFLIYWYSAFNSLCVQEKRVSDIDFIDKGLLLRSLGYELYTEHSDIHQKTLCTELSDIWSQKGTPLAMSKMMSMLDINNFILYEYWLDLDYSDNQLRFTPVVIENLSYNTGILALDPPPIKPYEAAVEGDPHWYLTEEEILESERSGDLSLPSLSPYVGLVSTNNWVKNSNYVNAYANRVCNDTYNDYLTNPKFNLRDYQKYYFYMISENISLLELYLAIGYTYNTYYNRTDVEPRDGVTERVPHFNGSEEKLYDQIQFVTEFNKTYRRIYSTKEKKELLEESKTNWQTLNPITCWTYEESKQILSTLSPTIYNLCNSMLESNQGYDLLIELLTMFDYFISHDTGLTSYSSLFMLFDPLKQYKDKIKKVFNYFKPIHTRLLDAMSYMIISDLPGDCFTTDEHLRFRIFKKIHEYYNNIADKVKLKIYQKFRDDIGRGYPDMFYDFVDLILVQRIVEPQIEIEDKILKLNMKQLFVEWYNLYEDKLRIKTTFNIKQDRIRYNTLPEPGEKPWYSVVIKEENHYVIKERLAEELALKDPYSIIDIVSQYHDNQITRDDYFGQIYSRYIEDGYLFKNTCEFYNMCQKVKDIYQLPDETKSLAFKFNVDRYILANDYVRIIANDSGLVFSTVTWKYDGDDYYIKYDDKDDPRIGDVLASVRDLQDTAINVLTIYTENTITLKSKVRFDGSLVLKQIDTKIPINARSWVYNDEIHLYNYYVDVNDFNIEPNRKYVLSVINNQKEAVGVNINHNDNIITLTSSLNFKGTILIVAAEVSKTFDSENDWEYDSESNTYRLTIDPYLNGLNEKVKEYIASVRDNNGDEVQCTMNYTYRGNVTALSSIKLDGNMVITGDVK